MFPPPPLLHKDMQQQVFFSMLDQQLHGRHPLKGSTTDVLASVQNNFYHIEHVKDTVSEREHVVCLSYSLQYC